MHFSKPQYKRHLFLSEVFISGAFVSVSMSAKTYLYDSLKGICRLFTGNMSIYCRRNTFAKGSLKVFIDFAFTIRSCTHVARASEKSRKFEREENIWANDTYSVLLPPFTWEHISMYSIYHTSCTEAFQLQLFMPIRSCGSHAINF